MHRKRSSSAEIIGGNDDLLMEILLFLPAKSLVRFKLVSKHWFSLIATRSFSRLHILHHPRRHPEPQHSLIFGGDESQFFICYPTIRRLVPFRFGFPYVRILQSSNGLLLLECRNAYSGFRIYRVFNPTTMRSRNLLRSKASVGLCLMFDPSESPHYKVYCFDRKDSDRLGVYDSETHTWKDWGNSLLGTSKSCDGFYWNGGIFLVRSHTTWSSTWSCLFFDGGIYEFHQAPRIHSPGAKKNYTMESNGHLHYLVLSLKVDDNCLFVYEMSNDDSDWFIKYHADFNPISAEFAGNNGTDINLLGMIRGDKEEDSILVFHVPGKIMIYRFLDKIFEVLVDFRREDYFKEDQLQFGFKNAYPFIASFAPV